MLAKRQTYIFPKLIKFSTENNKDERAQHHIAILSGVAAVFVFVVTVIVLAVIIWKKKSSKGMPLAFLEELRKDTCS